MRSPGPDLQSLAREITRLSTAAPVVHAASPVNWDAELARLCAARRAGERAQPAFVYRKPAASLAAAADALGSLARELDPLGAPFEPLAARAREASLELRLSASVATPAFLPLARERFACSARDDERAARWASLAAADDDEAPRTLSCDESSPASLVSAMRRAVGERRLPVRVVLCDGMAALAAAGDGVLFVARNRPVCARDVGRTVLHEIEGHAVPWLSRQRASSSGTRAAGDADAEEGRALLLEQKSGFLDRPRRKELGLRHVAAAMAHDALPFAQITQRLESLGAHPMAAIRIAARASRGGGLGRERVYLPWLWRLQAARIWEGERAEQGANDNRQGR